MDTDRRVSAFSLCRLLPYLLLFFTCGSLLCPSVAVAQVETPELNADFGAQDIEALYNELRELSQAVVGYKNLPEPEKGAWGSKISQPYDENAVPLDKPIVERLFQLMESKTLDSREDFWRVAHEAFLVLMYTAPASRRLSTLAKRILEAPLPEVIGYIPHENLYAGCLIALLKSGRQKDFDYVLRTESPEFWEGRASKSMLKEPRELPNSGSDCVVLALRFKAPMIMAKNRPEYAVQWLTSIVERPQENEVYKTWVSQSLQEARERLAGTYRRPAGIPSAQALPSDR